MIVYQADKRGFIKDVNSDNIENIIYFKYIERFGRKVSPNEVKSWMNSMVYMRDLLDIENIPDDSGVAIEYQVPLSSKRIDFILSGLDEDYRNLAIIVELKQWSKAERTNKDAIVKTYIGGGLRETSHPSYQAWSYARMITDYNEHVYSEDIGIYPCAYLHNYEPTDDTLTDPFYQEYLERAPLFRRREKHKLQEFIKKYIRYGDKGQTIYDIDQGKIRPSKSLADSLVSLLKGNQEFIMIDDQKIVYETVLEAASSQKVKKKVIIVDGAPGTGKSVVAINLLVELLNQRKNAQYVTRNAAPRAVYEAKLKNDFKKSHISNLFKGSGSYTESKPNEFDALVVDEAHRLNEKSGMFRNMGENQIKEIIHAAHCSIFLLDEDQRIHIHDIGDKEEILKWAKYHSADIVQLALESQFRCNGSDGYLAWVDNLLQIRKTANENIGELGYDFRVVSNPNELRKLIIEKNNIRNKSRMLAGYCWDWVSKKDKNKFDIEFPQYQFQMQWNLDDDGSLWIMKENSINEIGCIHTCQGLELDYAGVIIGDDMIFREGEVLTDVTKRSKNDRTVFGFKKLTKEDPDKAHELGGSIIKNTYRTLMTRGMKGCFVYCVDKELGEYIEEQLDSDPEK